MKKIFLFLLVLALLPACNKKGVQLFTGDYSYKMSGSVELTPSADSKIENLHFDITNEIGNLKISKLDKKEGSVMVVMNAMNGGLSTTTALCSDKDIEFEEFEHSLKLTNIAQGINTNFTVTVEAKGTMYDANTIVINARFSGEHTYLGKEYTIEGNDILIVAYRND